MLSLFQLWIDLLRGLSPPHEIVSNILLSFKLPAVDYSTSYIWGSSVFCIVILKHSMLSNSSFLSYALDFTSPNPLLSSPKDQGQSLENTCVRASPTPRIVNSPIEAAVKSHSENVNDTVSWQMISFWDPNFLPFLVMPRNEELWSKFWEHRRKKKHLETDFNLRVSSHSGH